MFAKIFLSAVNAVLVAGLLFFAGRRGPSLKPDWLLQFTGSRLFVEGLFTAEGRLRPGPVTALVALLLAVTLCVWLL